MADVATADDDEADDWTGYDSGPFCRHWGPLGSCERACVCGHRCPAHKEGYDEGCKECDCPEFREAEEQNEKAEHP